MKVNHYYAHSRYGLEADNDVIDPDIFQGMEDTCAIHSQYLILKDYGFQGSEAQLIDEATRNGWYIPGSGTSIEHMGKLLESHGVPFEIYPGANKYDLINALAHGRRIIVPVDSNELHNDSKLWRFLENQKDLTNPNPNHAVLVSGIDTSDVNNPQVILTDPGTGHAAVSYPLDQFLDSWADSNFTMVATTTPAPYDFNPVSMANFNYDEGHIPYFAKGIDFDDWQADCRSDFSSFFSHAGTMPVDAAFADAVDGLDADGVAAGVNSALQAINMADVNLSDVGQTDLDLSSVDLAALDLSDIDIDIDADSAGGMFSSLIDTLS